MTRVALNGMLARRTRTILTLLAIVVGVATISGAFTFSDTMRSAADSLSTAAYRGTDAVVSAHTTFHVSAQSEGQHPTIPAGMLGAVRRIPGVALAAGNIDDTAQVVGRNGKIAGSGPYFGVGLDARAGAGAGADRLSPFHLRSGRWATAPSEVVLDAGTLKKQQLRLGSQVRIATRGPARSFVVVGTASFGSLESIGSASISIFDLAAAQSLFGKDGRYDSVLVAARPGLSPVQLRSRLAADVPGVRVEAAAAQDRFDLRGLKSFVGIIRDVLLGFGAVAIFVGGFTIYNTLSITVAQRAREFGLLRTVGASRRQVLGSVVVEAVVVGLLGALVGLFAGLGLGSGLSALFSSMGLDLPQGATVFAAHTVVVSLLVGLVVTLVAGLQPALRATRVAPIGALRESAPVRDGRSGKVAVAVVVLGVALLAYGLFASGLGAGGRAAALLPGVLVLFIGVALLSPRLLGPVAGLVGRPAERFGGAAGGLARRNATRNPARTAATASALMIGIALVAFVSILSHGFTTSAQGSITNVVHAGYVVSGQDGFSSVDATTAAHLAGAPGVALASPVTQEEARALGAKLQVTGVEPASIGRVLRLDFAHGSAADFARLATGGAIVTKGYAAKHHLGIGSGLALTSASGRTLPTRVVAISSPPSIDPLRLGDVMVSSQGFARTFETRRDRFVLVAADRPASDAGARVLGARLARYPDAKIQTVSAYARAATTWIGQLTAIFSVMLALAVIVSLFGIVNTLALAVLERTRELGLLRAVGMSRRQVRRMIRHESVITALVGATLGIAVGVLLAVLATVALAGDGLRFTLPVGSLVAYAVVAIVAGMIAAILPARRAARLDVLAALQYE